jgi:hypothetical protein
MFYKKLSTALKSYGFEYNPYDACVANKVVGGKVLTNVIMLMTARFPTHKLK